MTDNQIITAAVDALTGKTIYEFDLVNRTYKFIPTPPDPKRTVLDKVFFRPIIKAEVPTQMEKSRHFVIKPTVVANQYRIASKSLSLPVDLFEDQSKMLAYVPEHLPTMIYIIAAAITNTRDEPNSELITYLEDNMDNIDVLQVLAASLQSANMQSFLISITLMNGLAKILQVSVNPLDGSELIASHTAA